jgi:hypothetical protein
MKDEKIGNELEK